MSATIPPIGTMRDRVSLLKKSETDDGAGGADIAFVPLATVWARLYPVAGSLTERSGARQVGATHTIVIRFRTDLLAGDRIALGARRFEVLSAEDLNGRRAYLECACAELQGTG